ncbi:MAG: UDP-glucose--hexose-1-phosphate uridylyltransferase [Lachnospiraceae bacterium]|nr:UDP-glucose--hexose-1-phosphate uridylyltransferase [Lachnospiraceae bacterium]MCI5588156.1 UDP-glucose--hexose-1-phosphate uridylyltransferase [Lachnospiraceae bacterium]MDD7667717.1 UDP-glucose--hexose-1-phosphate uridylyltransferase [Lachnospiraceae bacterium]
MDKVISELVSYGMLNGLITEDDKVYVINRLLELFDKKDFVWSDEQVRPIHLILEDMMNYAIEQGIMEDDTITTKDLFDTKIMGLITPMPSQVREKFQRLYSESPKLATDYYYKFSQDTNYIRRDRIEKDEKWTTDTEYGQIDITINLSKPEKDPRDIAKAATAKKNEYPKCLLCEENEGYAGHISHPARQNHRIIPVKLADRDYYFQYSPYVYYNEHCIVFNKEHTPMKIDKAVFVKLLDFVKQFPHYIVGSNADLPIVGGSILSHDHFQGGSYTFAMAKAPYEYMFQVKGYEDVTSGIVKWPMSVIRLQSKKPERIVELSDYILNAWRNYTDEDAFIFSETDGEPHNTITPIARMNGDLYEMDLVLRNNITTEEKPWGVYHPEEKLHHIKKENIGLIEVMGLAVLPARLKKEMLTLGEAIVEGKDIRTMEEIEKHADWVDEWRNHYNITKENVNQILKDEIAKVFVKVLECAGVYKRTEEGQNAFRKFISTL